MVLMLLKWHLLQDEFSEVGLVLCVAEVEQGQEVVQGQEVHGVRFGGAERYPDDLKIAIMINEVRLHDNISLQLPEYVEHLMIHPVVTTVDWFDPQEAAVSLALVDPILPPVTAKSCEDEILIILLLSGLWISCKF